MKSGVFVTSSIRTRNFGWTLSWGKADSFSLYSLVYFILVYFAVNRQCKQLVSTGFDRIEMFGQLGLHIVSKHQCGHAQYKAKRAPIKQLHPRPP